MELNDKLIELMDVKDREALGVRTPEERVEKVECQAEGKEHELVMAWVRLHGLKCIHAPTTRRVHDLEPGWPDFTLVYGNRVLLLEMKVSSKLREDQRRVIRELDAQGTEVHLTYSGDETIRHMRAWLWENFRWTPT
jgi:hypothetical protein